MSFWDEKPKSGEGDFVELIPADAYPAVLVGVLDCGTKTDTFPGQEPRDVRKVFLVWELTDMPKSQSTVNHTIGKQYTYSFHTKAALREMLEASIGAVFEEGKPYDVRTALGKPFLVTVEHHQSGERTFAKVKQVGKPARGTTVPAAQIKPVAWCIGEGATPEHDWIPYVFGKALKTVVAESPEGKVLAQRAAQQVGTQTPTSAAPPARQATPQRRPSPQTPAPVTPENEEAVPF